MRTIHKLDSCKIGKSNKGKKKYNKNKQDIGKGQVKLFACSLETIITDTKED